MSTLDVTGNSDRHFVRFAPSLQGRGRLRPWRWDGAAPAKGFVRAAESCCGRFPARRRRGVRSAYFPAAQATQTGVVDRKSVVWGKSVSVRVDLGGRRIIKKKKTKNTK